MNERIIPAPETISAHEQAAEEIKELRRKGIHCHLEEKSHEGGHCVDVVVDTDGPIGEVVPPPPRRPWVRWRRP